jgi:hypothetical protein
MTALSALGFFAAGVFLGRMYMGPGFVDLCRFLVRLGRK